MPCILCENKIKNHRLYNFTLQNIFLILYKDYVFLFLIYNTSVFPSGASHRFFFLIIIFYLRSRSMPYSIELGTSNIGSIPSYVFDLIGKFP